MHVFGSFILQILVTDLFFFLILFCIFRDLFPVSMDGLVDEFFTRSDVDPTKQSFSLTMAEWERLCETYAYLCKLYPGLSDYNYRAPGAKNTQALAPAPGGLSVEDLK